MALFPGLLLQKSSSESQPVDEINWDAFELEAKTKASQPSIECKLCKDLDWQDQEELNICKACGCIIERPLDMGAEYRFFSSDDRGGGDPCRVGPPVDPRFVDSSLGTIILPTSSGGHSSSRSQMLRIRRYHTWSMFPYKKRSLLHVFEQMTLVATNHGIEQRVIEIAKDLYMSLVEHCEKRGLSRSSIIASCIYSALKMIGAPRKPKDVADIFHLQNAQFTKAFKEFQCVLAMAKQKGLLSQTAIIPSELKTTKAADYIAFPLSKLPISRAHSEAIRSMCFQVAESIEENELSKENMPPSLASAVIAFVLHRSGYEKISSSEIASACDVSEGTLLKCLRRLEESKDILQKKIQSK
jgi:transcription initiation factor TFIIIB Brf1 subunit/transcription initiation factor TFIIB